MGAKIVIVGAGVAGLVAAQHCEEAGFSTILLEASDRIGGRLKTDVVEGFHLDRGFQVLLSEYDEVRHYLNLGELKVQKFGIGAWVFDKKKAFKVSDPLRDPSQMWPMIASPVGSLLDKWRLWRLTNYLKGQAKADLFKGKQQSTLSYLQEWGFSQKMIEQFFRPFFGGIFLENELKTDAAMFRFVFQQFSKGHALLPAEGIAAIPQQLFSKLRNTELRLNTKVSKIEGHELQLAAGDKMYFDKVIVATEPSKIIPALVSEPQVFNGTFNLYFEVNRPPVDGPYLALLSDPYNPINSFCVPSEVCKSLAPPGKHLLSVSLKSGIAAGDVSAKKVVAALKSLPGLADLELKELAAYHIPKSLPQVSELKYNVPFTQTALNDEIFLAGDYLLNASLDAAMRSGRLATEAMLASI